MFHLAQTVWPRFGRDRANSSLLRIAGPHASPTWRIIPLSAHSPTCLSPHSPSGVIVAPDGSLRVCAAGLLAAMTLDGTLLWQADLSGFASKKGELRVALPTALQTGEVLLVLPSNLLLVDQHGEIQSRQYQYLSSQTKRTTYEYFSPDDSGFSPNLTENGYLILSTPMGGVYLFKGDGWQEIGYYGCDIVTPAVYPDHSLAIAGYYGAGFCRVRLDGAIQWATAFSEADLLPTLNQDNVAAVGSLNQKCSAFFTSDGEQIGEYQHAARFAVYPDGGWIALSKQRLARLTLEGKEQWGIEICPAKNLSWVEQPIVDKDGFIFVRHEGGFLCCDAYGRQVFEVKLPASPQGPMSIVAPGVITYVMGNELFIGAS